MKIFYSQAVFNVEPVEIYPSKDLKEIIVAQGDMFFQGSIKDMTDMAEKIMFTAQDIDRQKKGI